jgi:hypothetical protein
LVRQRPLDQRPAAKEWKKPTKAVDEIWQMDATRSHPETFLSRMMAQAI